MKVIAALVAILAVGGCSHPTTGLVGTWTVTGSGDRWPWQTLGPSTIFTFRADGTYRQENPAVEKSPHTIEDGTYTLGGGAIELKRTRWSAGSRFPFPTQLTFDVALAGDELALTNHGFNGQSATMMLQRLR